MVPVVGLEPTRGISPTDFESVTSTNSITPARTRVLYNASGGLARKTFRGRVEGPQRLKKGDGGGISPKERGAGPFQRILRILFLYSKSGAPILRRNKQEGDGEMSREDYLRALSERLSGRMPAKELEKVIQYYADYFDEAGAEREQEVIEKLGDPAEVAATILEGTLQEKSKRKGMPTGAKVALVLVLVLLVGAAAIFALVRTVFRGDAHSTGGAVEAVRELQVELALGEVILQNGREYSADLQWQGEQYRMEYSCENGVLHIWDSVNGPSVLNNWGGKAVITLPQGSKLDEVTITSKAGSVELSDVETETLTVEAALGSVTLNGIQAGVGDLSLEAGSLEAADSSFSTLTAQLSLGGAELEDFKAGTGTFTLDSGSLDMERAAFTSFTADLSLGGITAQELTVEGSTDVRCSCGSVELYGSLGGETDVQADMGSITLETEYPEAEYGYELTTDLGSVTVAGRDQGSSAQKIQEGSKHFITARADLGSIEVIFK